MSLCLDCAVEVNFMWTHETSVCQRSDGVVSKFQLSAAVENLDSSWRSGTKNRGDSGEEERKGR